MKRAMVAVSLVGLTGCGSTSSAPRGPSPAVVAYYRCVQDSAASQMVAQARQQRDGNAIAELAFAACRSEEIAITTPLAALDISSLEIQELMNRHKLRLKQEIVAANPSPLSQQR